MDKRDTAIDIAKAMGILLMILGHCGEIPYMPYRHFIFTFHMPLFFIISGYFFKKMPIKASLIKDIRHLIYPYFYTCCAIIALSLLFAFHSDDYKQVIYYIEATLIGSGGPHRSCLLLSHVPSIGAIWFFPALYICKNVYNCISGYSTEKRMIFSSLIFICATLIGRYLIFIPFSILSGLSAIIFYAIGDFFKTQFKMKKIYWFLGITCWIISFKYSHLYIVNPQIDLYFIDVIGATTASLICYLVSKKIEHLRYSSHSLSWLGENTLYVLCFHLIDLNIGISTILTNGSSLLTISSRLVFPIMATLIFTKAKQIIKKKDRSLFSN